MQVPNNNQLRKKGGEGGMRGRRKGGRGKEGREGEGREGCEMGVGEFVA